MIEKDIEFNIECKRAIEYCFCCCPYCGNTITSCSCESDRLTKDMDLTTNRYHNHISNQSKHMHSYRSDEQDWWRLEKWQVGRRNFP